MVNKWLVLLMYVNLILAIPALIVATIIAIDAAVFDETLAKKIQKYFRERKK